MLEAICMTGAIIFTASAPIAFTFGMYYTYHPEAQRKMQNLCEKHKKIISSLFLAYTILSLTGILWVITRT